MKRTLTVKKEGSKAIVEIEPIGDQDQVVDILREIRDRLIEQVGLSEKGKVSLGRILSQKIL